MMFIRQEAPDDLSSIRAVNLAAFKTPAEADLVEVLRREANPTISLVALQDATVVGHIMFSPVSLSGYAGLKIMGLGPMAILPNHQHKGIGTAIVKAGLQACQNIGFGAAIVLGHTWFYPRFGFSPSLRYGIRSEYDVPDEVFMLIELQPGYLEGASGIIKYHPAFNNV